MMFKSNHQCQTLTRQLSKTDEAPTPSTSTAEYTDSAPRKTLTRQLSKTSTPTPSSPSNGASSRQRRERHDPSATAAVRNAAKRRPDAVPKPVALKAIVDSTPNSEMMRVRVPERLLRPAWKDINQDALEACGPEVADVPIKFIRESLKEIGPQMLAAARGQSLPARDIPTSIKVEEDESLPFAPTHMLAVYSPRDWAVGGRRAVRYVPVHDVVLAAHCTNLPALPPRNPSSSSIAVTSLRLPETTTFNVVLDYLYTKNVTAVLGALLPRSAVGVPAKSIPATIAKACTTAELTQRLFRTHALWTNVCALGVHDEALWNIIDSVWQVLLLALRISSEAGGPVNVAPIKP